MYADLISYTYKVFDRKNVYYRSSDQEIILQNMIWKYCNNKKYDKNYIKKTKITTAKILEIIKVKKNNLHNTKQLW